MLQAELDVFATIRLSLPVVFSINAMSDFARECIVAEELERRWEGGGLATDWQPERSSVVQKRVSTDVKSVGDRPRINTNFMRHIRVH